MASTLDSIAPTLVCISAEWVSSMDSIASTLPTLLPIVSKQSSSFNNKSNTNPTDTLTAQTQMDYELTQLWEHHLPQSLAAATVFYDFYMFLAGGWLGALISFPRPVSLLYHPMNGICATFIYRNNTDRVAGLFILMIFLVWAWRYGEASIFACVYTNKIHNHCKLSILYCATFHAYCDEHEVSSAGSMAVYARDQHIML